MKTEKIDITEKFIDGNFRECVYEIIDKKSPEPIFDCDVKEIVELNLLKKDISGLNGIEYFTALKVLNCGQNKITEIDVSKNKALTVLDCANNNLEYLDVFKNLELRELDFWNNNLEKIDISQNLKLEKLDCGCNSRLTSIDISKHILLTSYRCDECNSFKSIDVSKNTALKTLLFHSTRVKGIDVSNNPDLEELHCCYCGLKTVDVSKNPVLKWLSVDSNQLKTIDLSKNTKLRRFNCDFNNIVELDLSKNIKLKSLDCSQNKVSKLDLSKNAELVDLQCCGNMLTKIDISKNLKLDLERFLCHNYYEGDDLTIKVTELSELKIRRMPMTMHREMDYRRHLRDAYWELEKFFLKRKIELNEKFEWSQENREKIVEKSNDFMREFKAVFDEAKRQALILEERISNCDPYVNDYEMEVKLLFNYQDILENCGADNYNYNLLDEFMSDMCEISHNCGGHNSTQSVEERFSEKRYPIYINREENWNMENFPDDWDENMYVSYAVHQLVCDGILSFQDLLKISHFHSEVVVNIQKNDICLKDAF
jgi:hypothetical protein